MIKLIKQMKAICSNHASVGKSIYYNFKFLPFKQACKLPMIIAKGVYIQGKGEIIIDGWDMKESPSIYIGGKTLQWMPNTRKAPTIWKIDGKLHLNPQFYFGSGGGIEVSEQANLRFERGFNATGKCTIICRNSISFGQDVLVSWNTLFMDSDQHSLMDNDGKLLNYDDSIKIGNHVWISSNVTILKKTVIGNKCVVGCNTLIHDKFEQDNILIAGNPANIRRERINWSYKKPRRLEYIETN